MAASPPSPPHIDAPEGCTVIDAGGRLLTPGCVEAHCHIGLDNECLRWEGMDYNEIVEPLTPQLRAIDSINPQDVHHCVSMLHTARMHMEP